MRLGRFPYPERLVGGAMIGELVDASLQVELCGHDVLRRSLRVRWSGAVWLSLVGSKRLFTGSSRSAFR